MAEVTEILAAIERGDTRLTAYDCVEIAAHAPDERLLALDEALEGLSQEDPQAAELVKLRFREERPGRADRVLGRGLCR